MKRSQTSTVFSIASILALATLSTTAVAQEQNSDAAVEATLAQSVQELRQQVQELRAAVAEMKSEASQYRNDSEQLRHELEKLRASSQGQGTAGGEAASATSTPEQRLTNVEENSQLLASEVRAQYQTKVESASKYRVRLSGLLLMNVFGNNGFVDNQDFPTYAASLGNYGESGTVGATLRQSEFGLEVFGPDIAGAKSRGQVQIDFGGGFPLAAINGVNTGLVRMRTASMRLDWANTSIVAGQDNLFISPNDPTSFASLVVPSFGYSGNLWAWTPQLRIEHRFNLPGSQAISLQAGLLDNVTGEPSQLPQLMQSVVTPVDGNRVSTAGEATGQPAYAARGSWTRNLDGRPVVFGVSGYRARQHYGPTWDVTGWATAADWKIPLYAKLELSGELYRGLAVGGIGGAIGQSILFNGTPSSNPMNSSPNFRPLNSAGGWSQLKFIATPKLEFNGAFGIDNPFASDVHALTEPVSYYPQLLTSNRSEMMNFIFRPRSDLLFSGEYRHLRTTEIKSINQADQINLIMGVLF